MKPAHALSLFILWTGSLAVQAGELASIESGIPLEVEDAYATAYMNREFHVFG